MRSTLTAFLEPCEDFYEFICSGWMKTTKVPQDQVIQSIVSDVHRRVEDEITGRLHQAMPIIPRN